VACRLRRSVWEAGRTQGEARHRWLLYKSNAVFCVAPQRMPARRNALRGVLPAIRRARAGRGLARDEIDRRSISVHY